MPKSTIPQISSTPAVPEDIEEVEHPELAKLKARARARAAAASPSIPTANSAIGQTVKEAVVEVFLSTEIPNTSPLRVKIKTSSTLERLRLAWCGKEKFSDDMTRRVFLTWKNTKVFDSTTVLRLGIKIDDAGVITVDGTSELYDEDNPPRIHLVAWTEEVRRQWQIEVAERVAAEKRAAEPPKPVEEEPAVAQLAPDEEKIRLFLKVKGKADWKIAVYPVWLLLQIESAYVNTTYSILQSTILPLDSKRPTISLMISQLRSCSMESVCAQWTPWRMLKSRT